MRGIASYDSSSISMLFSSVGNSSNKGGTDLLGINYSDYASIKSGSYGKLVRSYYALEKNSDTKTGKDAVNKNSTSLSKDSTKTLAGIEESAQSLTESATALYSRKGSEVFSKDEKGNYNTDKIYDKVSAFVKDYNSLISSAEDSNTRRIRNTADSIQNITKVNANALQKIGISVKESDGSLSIDKEAFQKADMSKVKSLFHGTGSYAYSVATEASLAESYAKTEASRSNTYGSDGTYNYNYNNGFIFSDGF